MPHQALTPRRLSFTPIESPGPQRHASFSSATAQPNRVVHTGPRQSELTHVGLTPLHDLLAVAPGISPEGDDPGIDPRTGLSRQTTQRHLALLKILQEVPSRGSLPWKHLISRVREAYPNPSTQRTLLAASLGAYKRASTYLGVQLTIPHPGSVVQDRINFLSRQIRLQADFDQPGVTPDEIRQAMNRMTWRAKLMLALLVVTAHRGTSIADIRMGDVRVLPFPEWLEVPSPHVAQSLSDVPQIDPAPPLALPTNNGWTLVGIRFRSGKTDRFTGVYSIYVAVPAHLAHGLQQLLLRGGPRGSFLFGSDHRTVLREVSSHVSLRALRRETLRMLSWQNHTPGSAVRLLSRHTSDGALRTYLGGGLFSGDDAVSTTEMSSLLARNL